VPAGGPLGISEEVEGAFMKEILIFLGGAAVGAVGIVLTGFLSSAGSDLWSWLKHKKNPPEPEDRIVSKDFVPEDVPDVMNRRWVLDTSIADWEGKGYRPYRDNEGRRCMRQTRHSTGQLFEEFLMVKR